MNKILYLLATFFALLIFIALMETLSESDNKDIYFLDEKSSKSEEKYSNQLEELIDAKNVLVKQLVRDKFTYILVSLDSSSNIQIDFTPIDRKKEEDLIAALFFVFIAIGIFVLIFIFNNIELKENRKWYDTYKKEIFELLNNKDIFLLFHENEINKISDEIKELDARLEIGTVNDLIEQLTSFKNFKKEYIKRKEARITVLNNLKKEYQFYVRTEECLFDELINNKINNLETIHTFGEFEDEIYNISSLIAEDTKKILNKELKSIEKNINLLTEKWSKLNPKEWEIQEKNMRNLLADFYEKYMKKFIPDEKIKMQTNEIHHAGAIMLLINRKEAKFISNLYRDSDKNKNPESWNGTVRKKIYDYKKELRSELANSEYPNHYIIFTIKNALFDT